MRRMITAVLLTVLACLLACSPDQQRGTPFSDITIHGRDDDKDDPSGKDTEITEAMISAAGATELMVEKAKAYRDASCSATTRNGAYVYSAMVTKYATNPAKLAARLKLLGFKDVYLSPGKSAITNVSSWLKQFISNCHGYGMKVHAIRISDNSLLVTPSGADSEVSLITSYNSKVKADEKFDGISADLEAHTAKGSKHPSGLAYTWDSASNYGIGKDNDKLLDLTLQVLARARTKCNASGLTLSEAYWCNYQKYYDQGQLSYGSATQFLSCCDFLVIMAYYGTSDSSWKNSEPVLKNASGNGTVSICLKTAINESASDSIQSKGWEYLISSVKMLLEKGSAYTSFRGIDQFTYEGLETMWEWTNDKN